MLPRMEHEAEEKTQETPSQRYLPTILYRVLKRFLPTLRLNLPHPCRKSARQSWIHNPGGKGVGFVAKLA